jgi:chemotaxis signal transduction protein
MNDGLVCCVVGDEQYALRGADVRYIARAEQMRADTGPDGRVGSLAIERHSVPVFNLGRILGRSPSHRPGGAEQHIAVTGDAGALAGWLVDRIIRPSDSEKTEIVSLPPVIGEQAITWFDALTRVGGRSVLVLAPQYLNPAAPRPARRDPTTVFRAEPPRIDQHAERMAVIFSTPALPACAANRYALSGRQIAAIVQPVPPIAVPGSARHIAGVMWWRDAVVPVIDFRESDRPEAAGRRCLIAQCGPRLQGTLAAFVIDAEIAVHRPSATDQHLPEVPCPAFAAGMFNVERETVALLDLDALLV